MHLRGEVLSELFETAVYLFSASQEDKYVT